MQLENSTVIAFGLHIIFYGPRICMCDWESILLKAGVGEISVICYQYIGDQILKKLIKTTYPLTAREAESSLANCELTYEETNAVWYVAGYVVQSLQKKILKSTHAQRDDVIINYM